MRYKYGKFVWDFSKCVHLTEEIQIANKIRKSGKIVPFFH